MHKMYMHIPLVKYMPPYVDFIRMCGWILLGAELFLEGLLILAMI